MAFDFEDDDFDLDSGIGTQETAEEGSYGSEEVEYYTEAEFRARGIDPLRPTAAKPGSEAKVLMLAARYAAGADQFHRRGQAALDDGGVGTRQVLEEIGHVAALVHALGVRQQPGIDARAGDQKHPRARHLLAQPRERVADEFQQGEAGRRAPYRGHQQRLVLGVTEAAAQPGAA